MSKFKYAAAFALTLLGTNVNAADIGATSGSGYQGMTDIRPWSGPYATAFIGGEIDAIGLASDAGLSQKGVFGALRAGWDFPLPGGFVAGPLAEMALSSSSASVGDVSIDQRYRWELGGRIGHPLASLPGSPLLYVPVTYVSTHEQASGFDWSKDLYGWRTGAGVEMPLAPNWAINLEAGRTWQGSAGMGDTEAKASAIDARLGLTWRR